MTTEMLLTECKEIGNELRPGLGDWFVATAKEWRGLFFVFFPVFSFFSNVRDQFLPTYRIIKLRKTLQVQADQLAVDTTVTKDVLKNFILFSYFWGPNQLAKARAHSRWIILYLFPLWLVIAAFVNANNWEDYRAANP